MPEKLANNAATTLNGGIDASTTSVVVTSASGFPTAGNFRIIVDSEIMKVTSVSSNTFTVARGQEGTSGASHSNGADVTHIVTKESLETLRSDFSLSDTWANLPASDSTQAGRLYLPTDGCVLARDNGSVWKHYGPLYDLTVPINGDFSWVNQGSATIAQSGSSLYLEAPADATVNIKMREKTAPSTPYIITALMSCTIFNQNNMTFGLFFRESGTGEIQIFGMMYNAAYRLTSFKYNSATSFNASYKVQNVESGYRGVYNWFRISDDGTNRKCWYSADGKNWMEFHTIGRTDFLTADRVGFYVNSENATWKIGATLHSWKQE